VNLASIVNPHPPDALALVQGTRRVNFGQLREELEHARAGLVAHGVKPDDRVGLLCSASIEFVVSYLAVLGIGAVAVPLNPESPLEEIDSELSGVRPVAVVVGPSCECALEWLAEREYLTVGATELIAGSGPPAAIVDRLARDPAALMFTSGTAGLPKPAVLTHGSLLSNIEQMELRVGTAATSEDVALLLIPPFHIFGLNAVLGVQLFAGGPTVLAERFDPATALALVQMEKVSLLPGVPDLFVALATHPGARGDELASVRLAISGAAPLSAEVAALFHDRFGVPLWQGYGLTEASPAVTAPDLSGRYDPASVGSPLPGVEVKVIDSDGEEVLGGDPGEILVRGPNVFAGYFEDPVATERVLDGDGWLHTGDVAVLSDEGKITIVDRHKDLIIVSGFNVFPAEVENVLARHPGVLEAAVVGVPDPAHGESIRAFVVPRPGLWTGTSGTPDGLSESQLVRHCSRYLARYKCPAAVSFVRELPRSAHGKALRRELR
jgi:long-chain acyl-CoA synthetase